MTDSLKTAGPAPKLLHFNPKTWRKCEVPWKMKINLNFVSNTLLNGDIDRSMGVSAEIRECKGTQRSPSWETDCCSVLQEISRRVFNPKFQHHVYKNAPLDSTLTDPVHAIISVVFYILFKNELPIYTSIFQLSSSPQVFGLMIFFISYCSCVLHAPSNLIFLNLIIRLIFNEE
jgi:hypothetical protein